jgi:hypothetical protein
LSFPPSHENIYAGGGGWSKASMRRMAWFQGLGVDMVSCVNAASTASGAEEDEVEERPRNTSRRDAWP